MGVIPFTVALHALTVGCIGSMILGMMCRVTLGHTGNSIHADVLTIFAFLLMQGAAFIRVLGPWLMPEMMTQWIVVSAGLWALCFAIYLYGYSGILFAGCPESDGIRIQQGRS